MRARTASYCRAEATAPWGVSFNASAPAKFGLLVRGTCWLEVEGEAPLSLRAGDCWVIAPNRRVRVRDSLRTRAPTFEALNPPKRGGLFFLNGGGAPSSLVTGLFEADAWSAEPLFAWLPSVILVKSEDTAGSGLGATMQLLADETRVPGLGASVVIHRLAEILFVQTIRAFCASNDAPTQGWLAALRDPSLGAAVRAMHREPERTWSVDGLARLAGMSRSSFAARFKERVGEAPLEYLTRWRMYRAGCLLREGDDGIAAIASRVGYESAGAFQRAFQRAHHLTPGAFRRRPSL